MWPKLPCPNVACLHARNWKMKLHLRIEKCNFHIFWDPHVSLSLLLSRFSLAPQTFISYHYLIYLYFSSLAPTLNFISIFISIVIFIIHFSNQTGPYINVCTLHSLLPVICFLQCGYVVHIWTRVLGLYLPMELFIGHV